MGIKYWLDRISDCTGFLLAKETYTMASLMFSGQKEATAYELLEGIVIYFLYFEFIALITKYFCLVTIFH